MALADRPGALARVAAVLGEAGVSIDRMRQTRHEAAEAPVLIVTHPTTRAALDAALAGMEGTGVVLAPPVALRIEQV
jgi:homoserine dehydrogenase